MNKLFRYRQTDPVSTNWVKLVCKVSILLLKSKGLRKNTSNVDYSSINQIQKKNYQGGIYRKIRTNAIWPKQNLPFGGIIL